MEKLLRKILSHKTIMREDGQPYLTRFYVFRRWANWMPSIYIHKFHSSDYDSDLHNHPFSSFSLILKGSYTEEFRDGNFVRSRVLRPLNINLVGKEKFHRIELNNKSVWTIFFSISKDRSWGFWNRNTCEYLDFQDYKNKKIKK